MSWPDQKYVKFPFVKTTNIQCHNGVGTNGISIGKNAGYNTQGTNSIAIGNNAGYNTQGENAVAIGVNAGQNTQSSGAVAIGTNAGQIIQASDAVAIGNAAGQSNQGGTAVAIGSNAGQTNQGGSAVAIGSIAGQNNQAQFAIAVGSFAGVNIQGINAVAIGYQTGQNTQGGGAVAIGVLAGQRIQGAAAVAIGQSAGNSAQGGSAVAIGLQAGLNNQAQFAVAIGSNAGATNQGDNAVAIGQSAGQHTQGQYAVAIGLFAGQSIQGQYAVAIGQSAGQKTQGLGTVAIGYAAGQNIQGQNAVTIGNFAGQNTQGSGAVAIGNVAGQSNQGANAIAIGVSSGESTQGTNAVAIGTNAGRTLQGGSAVAIGVFAGRTNQGSGAIAIGANAGQGTQGLNALAIGVNAGATNQGGGAVALGFQAGQNNQQDSAIAIGYQVGETNQQAFAVAIGTFAAQTNQGGAAVAIGNFAGANSQGGSSVAIGVSAGRTNQGGSAVAIGNQAGRTNQGSGAVAIGYFAGASSQAANSIVISALGTIVTGATANATYIAPIRNIYNNQLLEYNTTTNEITYQPNYFDPSGNLDLSCNLIQDVSGIFFCDGTYIGHGASFDISTNEVLHISSSQNVLIDVSSSVIINGNVGIGTTTPTETLDVFGTIKATQFKTGGTASNTAGFTNSVYLESSVPSLTFSNTLGPNFGKYTLGATNGNFGIWNNVLSSYPLYINSSSNVGIGNSNPLSKLVVGNSMGSGYGATIDSSGTQFGAIIRTYSSNPPTDNNAILWLRNVNTTTPADTTLFRVNNNGNVVIGGTTPGARLDLKYDSSDTSPSTQVPNGLRIHNTNPTLNAIGLLSFAASVAGTAVGGIGIVNTGLTSSGQNLGRLTFYTKPTLTSLLTEKMTILGDGNVGIGTIQPIAPLTITTPINNGNLGVVGLNIQSNVAGLTGDVIPLTFTALTGTNRARAGLGMVVGTDWGQGNLAFYTRSGSDGSAFSVADEKMRITNDGNVGIGTTTPGLKLEVNTLTGAGAIVKSGVNASGELQNTGIRLNSSSASSVNSGDYLGITFGGNPNTSYSRAGIGAKFVGAGVGGGYGAADLVFQTRNAVDGSQLSSADIKMTITNGGNVGIGTTTPTNKLNIVGGLFPLKIETTTSGTEGVNLTLGYTGLTFNSISPSYKTFSIVNSLTGDALGLMNFNNGGSTRMTIANAGNVGIGTSSPQNRLHIYSSATNTAGLLVNGGANVPIGPPNFDSGEILIGSEPAAQGRFKYDRSNGHLYIENSYNDNNTNIYFRTKTVATAVDAMTILGSGNVGIGTTTPTEKLNISGGNLLMGGTFNGMLMNPGSGAGSLAITRGGNFINNVQQISGTYTDNIGSGAGGGAQVSLLKNEMSFSTYPTGTLGAPITLTERMRITSTGVGINTTTPLYKLQVEGSGTANEIVGWFNNQGAFSSSIAVRTANKTAYITNHQGLSTPNYTGQLSSALAFGVGSGVAPIQFWNGSPATAKMTLLSTNGNVGIGTTTPSTLLDVYGEGSFGFQDYRTQATQRVLTLKCEGISAAYTPSNYNFYTKPGIPSNGILSIRSQFGTAPESADLFSLAGNGNVGIGTTAPPAYPLDVVGSAKMTTIRDTANSVGTAGQVLSSTGSALSWTTPSFSLPMAIIQETQTAGTNSAISFVSGTSRPRQFNSKTEAGLSITLSGTPNWTFTIPTAGTYLIEANACYTTSATLTSWSTKLLLNNQTLGLGALIIGGNSKLVGSSSGTAGTMNDALLSGIITITGITVFSLDHYAVYGGSMSGGVALNLPAGTTEVYATLKITKIS